MRKLNAAVAKQRRQRVRDESVPRILDAAEVEFSQDSFKGASLDAIASRAGTTKRKILYFFGSKEKVYRAVLERCFSDWGVEMLVSEVASEPEKDPKIVLRNYISRLVSLAMEKPLHNKLIVAEFLRGGDIGLESLKARGSRKIVKDAVAVIQGWVDRGKMKSVDPFSFLVTIWGSIHFMVVFQSEVIYLKSSKSMTEKHWAEFENHMNRLLQSHFD